MVMTSDIESTGFWHRNKETGKGFSSEMPFYSTMPIPQIIICLIINLLRQMVHIGL